MDFGALPPEITRAVAYCGPGQPMLAAAAAWDGGRGVGVGCDRYVGDSRATGAPWRVRVVVDGGGGHAVCGSVELPRRGPSGMQAAAAAAYEAAFVMTVPPPVITANRVW